MWEVPTPTALPTATPCDMLNTEWMCNITCYPSVELDLKRIIQIKSTVYQSFPISMTVEQCLTVCHHEFECKSIYYQTESKNCTLYRRNIYEYHKYGKHVICQRIDALEKVIGSEKLDSYIIYLIVATGVLCCFSILCNFIF